MKLRVKDIVKIWNNGAASLVAGQEGLMRRIEVFDMMEQPNIKPWLREHLLLITTGYVIRNDKEALLNLIRDMNEVNASALAIKTRFFEDFPKEALQLADELKLPLFFLDNNAGFVELVFPVMTAIVESRSSSGSIFSWMNFNMIVLCCIYLKTRKYTNLSGVSLAH